MKTNFSLKFIVFAAACLLSVGTVSRLAAQDDAPVFVSKNGDLVTPPLTRTYSGPVTQTKAAVTTAGTITLSYYKGGRVVATTLLNGVTNTYSGSLLPSPPAVAFLSVRGKEVKNSGVLNSFDPIAPNGGVVNASVYITAQLPVFVDKSVAFGGFQNPDGSSLTFRADRDAK